MNLSISDELQLFSQELQQHMSPNAWEELASEVGFVQLYRISFISNIHKTLRSDVSLIYN
ncbi:hypothetical protein [Bacillus cereus group sp. BfR-BA-01383]|uniref:hypothetical protein n=1 Tax=Bacillus cereus group sp. BfR-BA-01383 TaxID=2920327 RepID=UPI001F57826A|nr:hypothetical protein [Bacillus cereus group sp. BfR-BA-01383]